MPSIRKTLRALLASLTSLAFLTAPCAAAEVTKSTRNAPLAAPRSADLNCLAEAVYFEAGGTGSQGEAAVAHVIVNRADSAKFPGTICGVVRDGCQFSYRCDGRSDALADPKRRDSAIRTAQAVLEGAPDITKGALFFHAAGAKPGWFGSRDRVGTFGGNVFYR